MLADVVSIDELEIWHDYTGVTFPVLWDKGNQMSDQYMDGQGRPQLIVIDRDLEIVFRGEGRDGHAAAIIEINRLLGK